MKPGNTHPKRLNRTITMRNLLKHILFFGLCILIHVMIMVPVYASNETSSGDLGFLSMDAQPSSAPEAPFVGSVVIRNNGNETSMSREVTFYLSADDNISSQDYSVGSVELSFLKPGETVYREIFSQIPSGIPTGNYTAGALLGKGFSLIPDPDKSNDMIIGGQINIQSAYIRPQEWFNHKIADLIFTYSNEERMLRDLPPLSRDTKLDEIAVEHSQDMAERNFFDHINPDGESPVDRAEKHHYVQSKKLADGSLFEGIGENIVKIPAEKNVYGYGDVSGDDPDQIARVAVDSFMDSKPHREALLLPQHEKIGIGVAFDGDYYYATQNFF